MEKGNFPRGWFKSFVQAHEPLRKSCGIALDWTHSLAFSRLYRRYASSLKSQLAQQASQAGNFRSKFLRLTMTAQEECAVEDKAEEEAAAPEYWDRFKSLNRVGSMYCDGVPNYLRRRARGGGRPPKAQAIREALIDWFSRVRFSVDTKIMCRFPKSVLLRKAQEFHREYLASCLKAGCTPERIKVDSTWLRRFMAHYRIVNLRPNRKYKVPRWVLKERLQIFWITMAKVRKFISLVHGYEPVCRNIDQSPFHNNEAGSKEHGTLCVKGAGIVPLIENHAATRERWSLNSVTISCEERIRARLPGFELMFKANGDKVESGLQAHVAAKGLHFPVTVVTGPSGSYREEDILNFFDMHLDPWGPGRRWEIVLLDAYAPGLTDNVQRSCWSKGYVLITHGGGASCVAQTNDTDHHQHVRRKYVEMETALYVKLARETGRPLVNLSRRDMVAMMIAAMRDENLHLQACAGYKKTGTTNALDGSEDFLICREAKTFWEECKMREQINSAVAEVEERWARGDLRWNYKSVQSLIGAYPRRGKLDVVLPGQEDEATPDPDGVPWEAEGEASEAGRGLKQVLNFDPLDWVEPEKAGDGAESPPRHGHGSAESPPHQARGSGAEPEAAQGPHTMVMVAQIAHHTKPAVAAQSPRRRRAQHTMVMVALSRALLRAVMAVALARALRTAAAVAARAQPRSRLALRTSTTAGGSLSRRQSASYLLMWTARPKCAP